MSSTLDSFAKGRGLVANESVKNLVMALTVEAAELTEIFQWKSAEESLPDNLGAAELEHAGQELADVLSYTLQIAGALGLDLGEEFERKMRINAIKYGLE